MKKYFRIIYIILILLLTFTCSKDSGSDDPDEPEEGTNKVQVYYSLDGVNRELLNDKDIVTIALADTFLLYVDISDASEVLDYSLDYARDNSQTGIDPFNFEDKGNYQYLFSTNKSGVFGISVFVNFKVDDFDYYLAGFYVKVPMIDYTIISLGTTTYIIDVDDDILKTEITDDLDAKYNLSMRPLTLACNTLTSGTYQLKELSGQISNGTFISTNTSDLTDLSFTYNNLTFNYNLVPEEDDEGKYGEGKYFQFTQDLTDIYKEKYPGQIINEVSLKFRGFRNKE